MWASRNRLWSSPWGNARSPQCIYETDLMQLSHKMNKWEVMFPRTHNKTADKESKNRTRCHTFSLTQLFHKLSLQVPPPKVQHHQDWASVIARNEESIWLSQVSRRDLLLESFITRCFKRCSFAESHIKSRGTKGLTTHSDIWCGYPKPQHFSLHKMPVQESFDKIGISPYWVCEECGWT